LVPIISETAGDSDLVTMERIWEMGTWESNGHVTDEGYITKQHVDILTRCSK